MSISRILLIAHKIFALHWFNAFEHLANACNVLALLQYIDIQNLLIHKFGCHLCWYANCQYSFSSDHFSERMEMSVRKGGKQAERSWDGERGRDNSEKGKIRQLPLISSSEFSTCIRKIFRVKNNNFKLLSNAFEPIDEKNECLHLKVNRIRNRNWMEFINALRCYICVCVCIPENKCTPSLFGIQRIQQMKM